MHVHIHPACITYIRHVLGARSNSDYHRTAALSRVHDGGIPRQLATTPSVAASRDGSGRSAFQQDTASTKTRKRQKAMLCHHVRLARAALRSQCVQLSPRRLQRQHLARLLLFLRHVYVQNEIFGIRLQHEVNAKEHVLQQHAR